MKKAIFCVFVLFAGIFANAQETKNIVYDARAQVRKVGEFKALEVSSAITVYLSQGNECSLAISAESDASAVKTEVKNGVLKIYVEGGFWKKWNRGDKKVKAYITVRDIEKIAASGACMVRITDKLSSPELNIVLTGASSVKGEIKAGIVRMSLSGASSTSATVSCRDLKMDLSGASSGNLSGLTDNLQIVVSGASNLKAYDLVTSTCSAEVSGASSLKVNVMKEFTKIEASGASSIRYKGNATIKNFEASGTSSVKKESR
jgi:hypothetical protein